MVLHKKNMGLGRGLNELLGDVAPVLAPDSSVAAPSGPPSSLPIELIHPNRQQPRRHFAEAALQELEDSIRSQGLLQAITVRPSPVEPGKYEIVAGERRWRAAQRVPLHSIAVVVRELSDQQVLEVALIENIQRQDLNPIEEAESYLRLVQEFGHSLEELATALGKSRPHVANLIRLLELPDAVRDLVAEGHLSMGHARALIGTPDPLSLARKAVADNLSVRQIEQLSRTAKTSFGASRRGSRRSGEEKDADTRALERDIAAALGMTVTVAFAGSKGTLTIAYSSLDELDELCQRLCTPMTMRG